MFPSVWTLVLLASATPGLAQQTTEGIMSILPISVPTGSGLNTVMPVIPTVPEVSLPVVTTGSLAPTSEGQMSIPAGETPITTALNTVIPVIPTTIPEVSLPVVTTGSLAPTSVVTSTVSSVGSGTPGASTSASTSGPPESTGAAAPAHAGAGYSSLVVVALSGLCFTIGFAWTLL